MLFKQSVPSCSTVYNEFLHNAILIKLLVLFVGHIF